MNKKVILEPIPYYGTHMTLKRFIQYVKDGCFIDFDGDGYYATKTKMTNKRIEPSDITGRTRRFNMETGKFYKIKKKINIDKSYKYVVWFNK